MFPPSVPPSFWLESSEESIQLAALRPCASSFATVEHVILEEESTSLGSVVGAAVASTPPS